MSALFHVGTTSAKPLQNRTGGQRLGCRGKTVTRDDSSHLALSAFHWGTYRVKVEDDRVSGLIPFEHDEDPSPIGHGITDVIDGPTCITVDDSKELVRRWPGAHTDRRGAEPFVEVSWERQNVLLPKNSRVCTEYGNESIYGDHMDGRAPGDFIMRRVTYTAS